MPGPGDTSTDSLEQPDRRRQHAGPARAHHRRGAGARADRAAAQARPRRARRAQPARARCARQRLFPGLALSSRRSRPTRRCWRSATAVRGERNPATIQILRDLGIYHSSLGANGAALPFFQKATELRLAVLGPNDVMTISVMNDVGNAYYFTGDYAKALETYERIVKIKLDKGGEAEANRLAARAGDDVSQPRPDRRRRADFEKLYQNASRATAKRNKDTIFALADVASVYAEEGRTRGPALDGRRRSRCAVADRRAAQESGYFAGLLAGSTTSSGARPKPCPARAGLAPAAALGETSFNGTARSARDRHRLSASRPQRRGGTAFEGGAARAHRRAREGHRKPSRACAMSRAPTKPPAARATPCRSMSASSPRSRLAGARRPVVGEPPVAVRPMGRGPTRAWRRSASPPTKPARLRARRAVRRPAPCFESTAFRRAAQSAELSEAEQQRLQGYERSSPTSTTASRRPTASRRAPSSRPARTEWCAS